MSDESALQDSRALHASGRDLAHASQYNELIDMNQQSLTCLT